MTKAVSKQKPSYGEGNKCRDFVFIEDVVKANLLASNANDLERRVFNVFAINCPELVEIKTDSVRRREV